MRMELKDNGDCLQNTQAVRVIDHVFSLLCCGRGHSSLTNIKILGDRLLQHEYLQREAWEKKHPITKDKIMLLNWIKGHISPKNFQVKEALLYCVHDLKLLEDKDLLEIENFELNQAMNILFDIQQSTRRIEERNSSPVHVDIKRMNNSQQVSTKTSRKPGNPGAHKEKTATIDVSGKGHLTPKASSPTTLTVSGSHSNDRKSNGKASRNDTSKETVQRKKPFGSSSSLSLSRPESTSSTTNSEKSYLHIHREKKAQQTDHTNHSVVHSTTNNDIQTANQQTGKRTVTSTRKYKSEHMETVLNRLMLRPSEDKRTFSDIVDVLSHDMRKKGMRNVLIQYLHENQPKYSLKHIGFSDGGEWSLFLRTECPDALLAYAVSQHYQVLLHVISVGVDNTEEIKFYPSPHVPNDEEKHVYVAYLADESFLSLLPMNASDFPSHVASSSEFRKCLNKIGDLEKENKLLKRKLQAVKVTEDDDDLSEDEMVALSNHVSLRLRRNSNNVEIDTLRQQLHLIKMKAEHKRT